MDPFCGVNKIAGPSPWDGHAAAATADACVESQKNGKTVEIKLGSRPALYHLDGRKKRVSKGKLHRMSTPAK
jgi:hypothetical protein